MAFERAVAILLRLREQLPVDNTQAKEARELLDRLARSRAPARREALVERVLPLLLDIDETQQYLRPILWELAIRDDSSRKQRLKRRPGDIFETSDYDFEIREDSGAQDLSIADFSPSFFSYRGPLRGASGATRRTQAGRPRLEHGLIERTPHLDVEGPEPIQVGSSMKVTVYLDEDELRDGEHGEKLKLPELQELHLGVTLTSSAHFNIRGNVQAEIVVRGGEPRSTSAVFEVDCVSDAQGQPGVAASFVYQWRPAGSVWRELEIAGTAKEQTGAVAATPAVEVSVDLAARAPDLLVEIQQSPDDERRFEVRVSTPHLKDYQKGICATWYLKERTKDVVEGFMEAFTTSDPGGRKAALIGAGKDLFKATPEVFKKAFWELAENDMIETIFVVTSEPFIPWELMVPNDGIKVRPPLGVEFSVGRWVDEQHVAPPQMLPITESYVIAPEYRAGKKLSFSAGEAQFVLNTFRGERISPAFIKTIDSKLAERGATLLHLICHGSDEPGGQTLDLDPDERLHEVQLGGLDGFVKAVGEQRPFVFINACQVGRPTPALVGTGGFAARFTGLGARCVIAPIWSVKDVVAEQVARKFYERIQAEPWTPFAEILRDIRKLAYEGDDPEDSYAAYCFYGDPLAAQCMEIS